MDNILLSYMSSRMVNDEKESLSPLPIITISREYGCYASKIAQILADHLSKRGKHNKHHWKVISKEILEKAAEELKLKPESISHVFGAEEKGVLSDIISSFSSKQYTSDTKIKKTITNVVKSYADQGYVIIVGRAGCVITKDYPKAFHIKLIAPFEWRVKQIADHYKLTEIQAKERTMDIDEKRSNFMGYFRGLKPECDLFDVVFNRMTLSEEEIVESVLKILETRKYF